MGSTNRPIFGSTASVPSDVTPSAFPVLESGDPHALEKYIAAIYDYAEGKTLEVIDWYLKRKASSKSGARKIRFCAIFLTTLGGLLPLLDASGILTSISHRASFALREIDFAQAAYICLALAGALIGLDKFFGFSSAWMRYLTTATTLQRVLHEFYFDWAALSSCPEGSPAASTKVKLERLQALVLRVHAELDKETAEWVAEYRSNLAQMEKSVHDELEASRPGSINISIPNIDKSKDGVDVLLDGAVIRRTTTPDCLLKPVFPGEHIVTIRGMVKNKPVAPFGAARVEPGRPCMITIELPENG